MIEDFYPWMTIGIIENLIPTDEGELPSSMIAAWQGFNSSLYLSDNAVPALNPNCLT